MADPAIVTASIFVGNELLKYVIKDVGIKRVEKWLFQSSYRTQLENVAQETILEFANRYPPKLGDRGKRQFYFSGELLSQMLKYVYFGETHIDFSKIQGQTDIIQPTSEQIKEFIDLFDSKIQNNKKLKNQYLQENYQERIFRTHEAINHLSKDVAAVAKDVKMLVAHLVPSYSAEEVKNTINAQAERQLQKQINTGKYIPDTFIESKSKDELRNICLPSFFLSKFLVDIAKFDFRYLNDHYTKNNLPTFQLDITPFVELATNDTTAAFDSLLAYLRARLAWLQASEVRNISSTFERKLSTAIETLKLFHKKVVLITDHAGQGKTNIVCDFVQKALLRRNSPVTFLTGNEVDSNDIFTSILRLLFPGEQSISFNTLTKHLEENYKASGQVWTIVIDGINENPQTNPFCNALEKFIEHCVQFPYIRIILTCRTEYFENNFSRLKTASFKDSIHSIYDLNRNLGERGKGRLLEAYMEHYRLKVNSISQHVEEQLVDDFLLLRIFAETYQGQTIDIHDIYKAELFERYYNRKCEEINNRTKDSRDFGVSTGINTRDFLEAITKQMIENRQFVNLPLDNLIRDPQKRESYVQFIDENILLRRDLPSSSADGIFAEKEVVNFTFDEFRDYCISNFLLTKYSKDDFAFFINDFLADDSRISEGCCTFIYLIIKRNRLTDHESLIKKASWYQRTFIKCVLLLQEAEITENDIRDLKMAFRANVTNAKRICSTLAFRRANVSVYPKLNILVLFDILLELSDEEIEKGFYAFFLSNRSYEETNLDYVCEFLSEIIYDSENEDAKRYANHFKLLVFLFPKDYRIQAVYERFHFQYPELAVDGLKMVLKSKSQKLVKSVEIFMRRYDIEV